MADKPPVKSVVVKTKKPTAEQRAIIQSRRNIGVGQGTPQRANAGTSAITPLVPQQPLPPIPVDQYGIVLNPVSDVISSLKPTQLPSKPRGKVQIKLNRDGTVTATANGNTQTAKPTPLPATQGMPQLPTAETRPHAGRNGKYSTYRDDLLPTDGAKPHGTIKFTAGKGYYVDDAAPAKRNPAAAGGAAPAPMSDFDLAKTRANTLLDPIIKQVTDLLNQRIKNEQSAITGYSGELARLYGLYSGTAGKAYDSGIASTAAVNDALARRLDGVTATAGSDLTSRLASIAADPETAARISADVAAAGKGAANAGFALGSADLSSMLARKTSAQDYGAKLPGLAGLYGLRDTLAAQASGTKDLATALVDIQGKAPSLVSSLLTQIQSNRNQRAQLAFERAQFGVKQKIATADKAYQREKDKASLEIRLKELGLSKARLKRQFAKDERDLKIKGALRGLTPGKYQELTAKAAGAARNYHSTWTDGDGNEQEPLPWLQYIKAGLAAGVPQWILIQEGRKVYSQPEINKGLIPGRSNG